MKLPIDARILVYALACISSVFLAIEYTRIAPTLEYIQPHHTPRPTCSPRSTKAASPDIVIYIPTPIEWVERRHTVLSQFLRESHADVHLLFFFGTKQGPNLELEMDNIDAGRKEAARHRALHPRVQYMFTECRDFGDEPNNPNGTSSTTCKVYEALRHIAHAYRDSPPKYVWRGADDAYLDIAVFRKHVMPLIQSCRLFLGRTRFPLPGRQKDLELLPHQPALHTLFGLQKFGKYMVGMGFCMSWDVAAFIGNAPIPPRLTWCEDVMVGHWLLFYDVDFVDIRSVTPKVRMLHADMERYEPFYHVLVAHKMSRSQWVALARRPLDSHLAVYLEGNH
jgi:hypothetical protein